MYDILRVYSVYLMDLKAKRACETCHLATLSSLEMQSGRTRQGDLGRTGPYVTNCFL